MPESSSQKIAFREVADPIAIIHPISGESLEKSSWQIADNNSSDTNVMKLNLIDYKQTGGVGGVNISFTVDGDSLANSEALEVQDIINEIRFIKLNSDPVQEVYPDYYNFTITVETEEDKHTLLRYASSPGSTDIKPLINWITGICSENDEKKCK
jgi:hypothetical protein